MKNRRKRDSKEELLPRKALWKGQTFIDIVLSSTFFRYSRSVVLNARQHTEAKNKLFGHFIIIIADDF